MRIPHLIPELRAAFDEFGLTGEVILVDDGSTDGTAALAEAEGAGWDRLRVLRHRVNQGKTEALRAGSATWSSSTPTSSTCPPRSPVS